MRKLIFSLGIIVSLFSSCSNEQITPKSPPQNPNDTESSTTPGGEDDDDWIVQWVFDSFGNALSNASVTLTNQDTSISSLTDVNGKCSLLLDSGGLYTKVIEKQGYVPDEETVQITISLTTFSDTLSLQ